MTTPWTHPSYCCRVFTFDISCQFVPSRSGRFGSSFRVGVPRSWTVNALVACWWEEKVDVFEGLAIFRREVDPFVVFNLHQPELACWLVPLPWNSLRQRCLLLKLTKKQVPVEMMTSGDMGMFHRRFFVLGVNSLKFFEREDSRFVECLFWSMLAKSQLRELLLSLDVDAKTFG